MDLLDCVAYHQLSLHAEGRSPATLRLYLVYQRRFLEFLESRSIPPTLDALNPVNVRNGLEWCRTRPRNGAQGGQIATQAFVATLKTWARFLETEGIFTESPLTRIKRPKVPKVLRQPFTAQEMMALWSASRQTRLPLRDEALLLLLFETGMRIGEAVTLTLDKVRLNERHIVVGLEGKGRRERLVPIGDSTKRDGGRVIRVLRAYLRERPAGPTQHVFVDRRGFPLSPDAGSDIFKRIGAIAGVVDAIPHRARHSFATWYLTANPGDELGLRRIIGHSSREVTADYVHFAQTTIADRAGRASLVESLSAPKDTSSRNPHEPIAKAWGIGTFEPPPPPPVTPRNRISDLLTGLDAAERRALLKALLNGDAA
jgi:site-specific recombinase XerD